MGSTILQLLLDRVGAEGSTHVRRERGRVQVDQDKLPDMYAVGEDWSLSGTNRWRPKELTCLQNFSVDNLAIELCACEPWDCIAGLSEVILHGEEERSKLVAQEILYFNPERFETFRFYFGDRLTHALLGEEE